MPIRQGRTLASRASTWPRDHFCRNTMLPRRSWPTRRNEFLPISIPITAISLSSFWDMACSFVFGVPTSFALLAGLERQSWPDETQRLLADIDPDYGDFAIEFLGHGVLLCLWCPDQLCFASRVGAPILARRDATTSCRYRSRLRRFRYRVSGTWRAPLSLVSRPALLC